MNPKISLDYWRALVAVVDAGGYAQAAKQLHKTQSSITYAIKKIEQLLGLKVFAIEGRKAQLTDVGQVLYRRGKLLLKQADQLEQAAEKLAHGWEPELRLAVDTLFPTWLLLEILQEFGQNHPHIRIELLETVRGGSEEALLEGQADLAICPTVPPGFLGHALMRVRMLAAAHPNHPLHHLGRSITKSDLDQHRHLIIRDSGKNRHHNDTWLGERRWTVSHKATSIQAACLGLGYAWFAEDTIRRELTSGQLKPLPLATGDDRFYELSLVLADHDAAGPGLNFLASLIKQRVASTCQAQKGL